MSFETTYSGPTQLCEVRSGGRTVRIERPADPDCLLEDPAVIDLNRRDDYMPYWAYLWPGAILLAEAVGREGWPAAARTLEIGCGLGAGGLAALAAGVARVQFSDYDEAPLSFVARSAAANGFGTERYTLRRLDWRAPPDERFDLILGADVLYERRLVPLVGNLLRRLLAAGGQALIAGPYRVATLEFGPYLASVGLAYEESQVTAVDEGGRPVCGTLHRVYGENAECGVRNAE